MELINISEPLSYSEIINKAKNLFSNGQNKNNSFCELCKLISNSNFSHFQNTTIIQEIAEISGIREKLWKEQIKQIQKETKVLLKTALNNTSNPLQIQEKTSKNKKSEKFSFWEKNGFYVDNNNYYKLDNSKKVTIEVLLSNFVMNILYHLDDGTNNTGRLVKLIRTNNEEYLVEILSSEFSMDKFETILKSKRCSFFGSMYDLKRIVTYLMDLEISCIKINTLGYNAEHNFYVFADGIIVPTGIETNQFIKVNEMGIVENAGKNFYLPAFSSTNIDNDEYLSMRDFFYNQGSIDFKEFSKLFFTAYGVNGAIGLCHIINALFWDIVFKECEFFPFLFLFGQAGGGKTSFIELLLRLFGGGKIKGTTIRGTTDKGLSRTVSQRLNSLFYLKEYTNDIEGKVINFFKNAYDGDLYTMAQKSNDNRTNTLNIKTACMIDGNELPTAEAAMFSRMIIITFKNNVFTKEMGEAYQKLGSLQEKGFCGITKEILKYREHFKTNFQNKFRENLEIIKNSKLEVITDMPERTKKHIAFLITPFHILKDKIEFPFQEAEIVNAIIDYSVSQNDMLNEVKDTTVFWEAASYYFTNDEHKMFGLVANRDYYISVSDNIISIKFKQFYAAYITYCKMKNIKGIDSSSMKSMLTEGYKYFISGNQKSLNGRKIYVDDIIGSCYRFSLQSNNNALNRVYYIENIELKVLL